MLAIFKIQNQLDGNTGVLRLFCKFLKINMLFHLIDFSCLLDVKISCNLTQVSLQSVSNRTLKWCRLYAEMAQMAC